MMHEMDQGLITLLYSGILAFLLIILSLRVSLDRGRAKVDIGTQGADERFLRINRAHGNLTEYLAIALLLIYFVEVTGSGAMWVHGLGIALVIARVAHAIGISNKVPPLRLMGAVVNLTVIGVAAVLCLVRFFGS